VDCIDEEDIFLNSESEIEIGHDNNECNGWITKIVM